MKRKTARGPGAWPRISTRRRTKVSPWVSLIARTVEFSRGGAPQVYHAVEQADYVSIVARNRAGKLALVWQYRPTVEAYTWEVPAGMVDPGETPEDCCRRELVEEIGHPARTVRYLADSSPCTGRLSNRIHSYFVEVGERVTPFHPEPGITVKWVSPKELAQMIRAGKFVSQLHLGTLMLAELHGYLKLPRPAARKQRRQSRRRSQNSRSAPAR